MVTDDLQDRIDDLIERRLPTVRRVSGIPIVFGGATRQGPGGIEQVVIGKLLGTVTEAMNGLTVVRGRGLGGTAIERMKPCMVRDYASSTAISHDYDDSVVHQEGLTSIVAVPIRGRHRIGGVLYAAVRSDTTIGDRAVGDAVAATRQLEREILGLDGGPAGGPLDHQAALDELAALARASRDPHIRARLGEIHRRLSPSSTRAAGSVRLTPRELDVIRVVATGSSNSEVAEQLGLSPESVKTYVRNTMRKLQVRNRTAAVHAARTSGLL